LPDEHSLRLKRNFDFFDEKVAALNSDLDILCKGLHKLVIVDVSLSRDQDNPQLIFESMNSTDRELSQADLIRNYILMGLEPKHQTRLYEDHRRPMEIEFGQEAYGSHFDSFTRHYLTLKTGEIPNVRAVYDAFKAYSREPRIESEGVDALVRDIQTFAGYYCTIALGKERHKAIAEAFQDLRELKVDVAYPFLLELYHDYATDVLSRDDFEKAIRLVEAYVCRRTICAIPTNSLNKTFATFRRSLTKERYLESIQATFLLLPSYRRFPTDEEFRREFTVRDLYNFPRRSYWLRRLENHERKERVPVDEYTIEHILPQNQQVSSRWRRDLGPDWERIHRTRLHTLGNLTLTAYNSEYSDRTFIEKRDMNGGFRESPLRLNKGLAAIEIWNEAAIEERANRLASIATRVWPAPNLGSAVLDVYTSRSEKVPSSYSIKDHAYLATGTRARELFDALRKELLALDPCVTEQFLKLYVAYKAETNFVDVVPQTNRLRLSLNMAFHELHDPRGIAKDVSSVGRWGNGDVEVALSFIDEIPYILGLIRQSFEKQMGNGGSSE
jgi:predicted transport protein